MENNSKDAQMYLKNINRIADAVSKIASVKMKEVELTDKCCKLEEKCNKKQMVCNWYDAFAQYIQEQDTAMYNDACEYADEIEDLSNCCESELINGRCSDCKEGAVSIKDEKDEK